MNKQVDVLNLEWTSTPSRDRVMATLVCNYLRIQGLHVEEKCVFDGFHEINKCNPRLLFMTNTTGAPENFELMRYAKSRGYLGLSLISEGNFTRDTGNHIEMIWGWNKEKKLYEDRYLLWSERTRSITLNLHPELEGKVGVSGGVGFDNYRLKNIQSDRMNILLNLKKENYKKIIGIGCFDFGTMYPDDYRYPINMKSFTGEQIQRFRNDGIDFDRVLSSVANLCSDTLFLVKQHPGGLLGNKASGTVELSKLANVLVVNTELSIHDCINLSDFWITYESTTALEAWLLGKQTCLLNPSGRDFPRDMLVSEGSPAYGSSHELLSAIENFYNSGALPGYSEREELRNHIIKQTIEWNDGLNHVRAGNAILDLLDSVQDKNTLGEDLTQKYTRFKQHFRWVMSPIVSKIKPYHNKCSNKDNFNDADLKIFAAEMQSEQDFFYHSQKFNLSQLRQIRGM
jgi:hypothetical protein